MSCPHQKLVLLVTYALIEYFLGKTKKTQAASVLELMLISLAAVWGYFTLKGGENHDPR